jgi:hypothetical protein
MANETYSRIDSDNEDINYIQGQLESIILALSRRIIDLENRLKKLEG